MISSRGHSQRLKVNLAPAYNSLDQSAVRAVRKFIDRIEVECKRRGQLWRYARCHPGCRVCLIRAKAGMNP
jgi:hypothetical protein